MLHQIKAPQFYTYIVDPPVNGKIQGFFKASECFSSTFHGKFNFQGFYKTVLYIQVLFKPVRTLCTVKNCKIYLPFFEINKNSLCILESSLFL